MMDTRTLKMVRLAGIAGITAAIFWTIGDVLILGNPVATPDDYPLLAQYPDLIGADLASQMLAASAGRLMWGALAGALTIPLYLAAAWHLYQALKPAGWWLSAPPYALIFCGFALAPFAHGAFFFVGEVYKAINALDPSAHVYLIQMLSDFANALVIDYAIVLVLITIGLVWLTVAVALGKTRYPRWVAIPNPIVWMVVGSLADAVLPEPLSTLLVGAGFNLGFLGFFTLSTIVLWNGGRLASAKIIGQGA